MIKIQAKRFITTWLLSPEITKLISTLIGYISAKPRKDPLAAYVSDDWALWRNALSSAQNYLEYGCGASTEFAAKTYSCNIRAVETSLEWAQQVTTALGARAEVVHIDLGPVGGWGRPTGYRRAAAFPEYFNAGFESDFDPDVVLIDGRFRVAVFLAVVRNARVGTQIVFDDYAYREFYHVVEQLVKPVEINHRQALFLRPATVDRELLDSLQLQFSMVMD
jgi:hypothetical protein